MMMNKKQITHKTREEIGLVEETFDIICVLKPILSDGLVLVNRYPNFHKNQPYKLEPS